MLFLILTVTIALSISFICSLLEATLLSLSATDVAKISEKKPGIAKLWTGFKNNIQKPIAVILIINTFAHTIGAAVSGSQFNELYGAKWIGVYSIVFSMVMIQWTEMLPKTLGVKHNRFFAVITAVPLKWLIFLLYPIVFLMQIINRPFSGRKEDEAEIDAINEIRVLAHFAKSQKIISLEQAGIVERGLRLSMKTVSDIMIKREDCKYLSTDMSLGEALVESHIHHHTRFPLVNGKNIDDILGYVNFKDIVSALQYNPRDPSLKGISRPVLSVSEDENLSSLLERMTKNYQHIALVRDKNGKTAGLVTLEDVIESIVGDIKDEYDILPKFFYQIAENRYVSGGGIELKKVSLELGVMFQNDSINLNEWLSGKLLNDIKAEARYDYNGLRFTVRKVRRSKIHEIIIDRI